VHRRAGRPPYVPWGGGRLEGPDGSNAKACQNRNVAGTGDWTDPSDYDNGVSGKVTSITGHTVVGTFRPTPDPAGATSTAWPESSPSAASTPRPISTVYGAADSASTPH
jgi:hypothetical protein